MTRSSTARRTALAISSGRIDAFFGWDLH
jgi:hypothetical protein